MNQKLWNDEISNSVLNYITNTTEKNKIFNKELFPVLTNYIDIVIKKTGVPNDSEHRQVLLIKSLEILKRINPENIGTAQQYIYRALYNTSLLFYRKPKIVQYIDSYIDCSLVTVDGYQYEQDEIRNDIMNAIDDKINVFSVVKNKSNVVFLLLLKQYLLDNDFDVRGFDEFIMEEMNISISQFRNLACSLNIRTKVLRERLIN